MSEWSREKKESFVAKRGKRRPSFARGGIVRRKRFAGGGTALGGPEISGNGNAAPTLIGGGISPAVAQFLGFNNNYIPNGAPIQAGTNAGQLNAGYEGAQTAIGNQRGLVSQFNPGGQQGVQTEAELTSRLEGIANGHGPNPAQAALAEATRRNIANQTAVAAGQRGASSNVGLIARQAAQQGAETQQQEVGQAATMEAQQQIAANQQLQNLSATQVGQQVGAIQGLSNAEQNEQNILQGANTALNSAQVGMQSNINSVEGQVAAGNAAAAGATAGGIASGLGGLAMGLGLLLNKGGEVPHLAAGGAPPLIADPIRGPGTVGPGNGSGTEVGPWLNSAPASGGAPAATALPPIPEAKPVNFSPNMGIANAIAKLKGAPATLDMSGIAEPSMTEGDSFSGAAVDDLAGSDMAFAAKGGRISQGPHRSHVANFLHGGRAEKVPAMVSPGEVYLSPEKVRKVIEEGANPMKVGQKIHGKAKRANDSLKNDTVPMTLEEGGVVIPRHITTHKMAAEKAELFVHRAIARKRARGH